MSETELSPPIHPSTPLPPQSRFAEAFDCNPISTITALGLPEVHTWREGATYFVFCTRDVFPTITHERGMSEIVRRLSNAYLTPLTRVFPQVEYLCEQARQDKRVPEQTLAEICALAAVATQYSKGRIPEAQGEMLFNLAKLFSSPESLEDDLVAAGTLALFAVYGMVRKSLGALNDIGLWPRASF